MRQPKKFGFYGLEYEQSNMDSITPEVYLSKYPEYTNQPRLAWYKTFKYDVELHYDMSKKQWVHLKEYTGHWYPATYPCHSLKAAKRHLKKHDEIPKGSKFRFVSKYVGCDIYLTKK